MQVNLVEFLKLHCTSNIFGKRFVQWLARQTRYQKVWVRDLAWPCAVFLSKTLYSHSASQYLSNCAPTPPLYQQQLIDCKIGLMLGRGGVGAQLLQMGTSQLIEVPSRLMKSRGNIMFSKPG